MLDDKVKANIRQQFNQCSKSDENSVRKLYERIDRKYYNTDDIRFVGRQGNDQERMAGANSVP